MKDLEGRRKAGMKEKIEKVLERGVSSWELQMRGKQQFANERIKQEMCCCLVAQVPKEEMRSQLKVTALRKNYFRWRTKNCVNLVTRVWNHGGRKVNVQWCWRFKPGWSQKMVWRWGGGGEGETWAWLASSQFTESPSQHMHYHISFPK